MDERVRELLIKLAEEKSRQQLPPINQPVESLQPKDQQIAGTTMEDFFKVLPPAFNKPAALPELTPEQIYQQKQDKIRKENRERYEGTREPYYPKNDES